MARTGTGRVFVDFYDYVNVGDDLLFVTLAKRYPDVAFAYLGDKSDGSAFDGLPNVRRLRRIPYVDGVLRRLRIPLSLNDLRRRLLVERSPLVVRLGGSLYMERGDWRRNVARDRELLRNRGGAFFLNGNFGPWRSPEFLATYESIFARALDVTVRDSASAEQLAAVPQVRLAPDMLFCVPPAGDGRPRRGVVVSLIDLTGREGLEQHRDGYEQAMAELVDDLVTRRGEQVTLVSFCPIEGDEAAIDRVLSLLSDDARRSITTYRYGGDIDGILHVLRGADTVVATRFHAMVLGFAFGARVCCVEYSNKVTNALRDLDAAGLGWKLEEFVGATREERYRRIDALEPWQPGGIGEAAQEHFAVLDRHLGRGRA